jgi:hypothetical protein
MTSDDQVLLVDWPDTPAGFWHLTFRRLADEKRGGNGCLRYAMLTGSGYAPEGLSVR